MSNFYNYIVVAGDTFQANTDEQIAIARTELALNQQPSARVWSTNFPAETTAEQIDSLDNFYADAVCLGYDIYSNEPETTIAVAAALETAKLFVEVFGEALDPSETDWDAVAWEADSDKLFTGSDYRTREHLSDFYWETYQTALISATKKLAARGAR